MEIFVKGYEDRFYPSGQIYKMNIRTSRELEELFYIFNSEDGRRTGGVRFKTKDDKVWLKYGEFLLKYFKGQYERPIFEPDDFVVFGVEDSNGRFKSCEELQRERESELAEIEAINREKYYEELILNMEKNYEQNGELKEDWEHWRNIW